MNLNKLGFLFVILFAFVTYRFLISTNPLVANDWPLLFGESRDFIPFWSIAWDYMGQGGVGAPAFKTFWIDLYTNFVYFISNLTSIPWWLSQRIFWVLPFIALSTLSSYKFSGLFIKDNSLRAVSSLIYSFNTYILLIVAGGQFGIAFSYAIAPFVLLNFINLSRNLNVLNLILHGVLFGIMVAFDPRIAFLIFLVEIFWFMLFIRNFKKFHLYILSFLIASLINLYWILPFILFRDSSSVFSGYTSLEGVKFLSFATFENSISLLHPNWPENIFGKIYFQKPEFLIVPIIAFSSLLFKVKKEILFFAALGLAGIFLGKGTNHPFGAVYIFLFQYLPGFNLFRDPTKFYILIAISYSILIPFFLQSLSSRFQKYKNLIIFAFLVYLMIVLKPGWSGELTGIFRPKDLPTEYAMLTSLLKDDKEFSRTLWIPRRQKYGFYDPNHPAIDSEALFKSRKLENISQKQLSDLSIKYVIVPYDSDGEIFLKDRKYDEKSYSRTINKVENSYGLNRIDGFDNLAVYSLYNPREHFWSSSGMDIKYKFVNPTRYEVNIQNAKKGDVLVFSEGFDKNWVAENSEFIVESSKSEGLLNSFRLPRDGNYSLEVYYEPQEWVNIGLIISGLTLTFIISFLFRSRKKR